MGLVALQHVESSWTRDEIHVLWISRWVLNHLTMREVHRYFSYKLATNQISRDEIQRWRKILDFCKSISVSNMSTTYKKKKSQWQVLLHAVFISPPDFCKAAIQSSLLIWKNLLCIHPTSFLTLCVFSLFALIILSESLCVFFQSFKKSSFGFYWSSQFFFLFHLFLLSFFMNLIHLLYM